MSIDGAADIAIEAHPHGESPVHQVDGEPQASTPASTDTEFDGDHAEHCCHGHMASIATQVTPLAAPLSAGARTVTRSAQVANYAQAPPTPPPNP